MVQTTNTPLRQLKRYIQKSAFLTALGIVGALSSQAQDIFVNARNIQIVNGAAPSITFDVFISGSSTYVSNATGDVNRGLQNVDVAFEVDFGTNGSAAANTTTPIVASSYSSSAIQSNTNSIVGAALSGAMQPNYDSRFKFNLDRVTGNAPITTTQAKAGTFTVNYPNGTTIGTPANGAKIAIRTTTGGTGSKWSDFLGNTGQAIGTNNTFANATPLNTNLLSFNAQPAGEHRSLINWTTTSEAGTSYFEVERATANNSTEFQSLNLRMPAVGKTTATDYQAYDESPVVGVNYYRLKMVDLSGTVTYSPTQVVRFTKGFAQTVSLFPNPIAAATSTVKLAISTETAQAVDYTLLDVTGKRVYTGQLAVTAGNGEYVVEGFDGLAAGNYLLQVKGTTLSETIKVLKK